MPTLPQEDQTLFKESLHVLTITVENHNGQAWNQLMSDLEATYKTADSEFDFLIHASGQCSKLVSLYFWDAFPITSRLRYGGTSLLSASRTQLIVAASTSIAIGAMQEFQLGNFQ
jgi:hypothetical protein